VINIQRQLLRLPPPSSRNSPNGVYFEDYDLKLAREFKYTDNNYIRECIHKWQQHVGHSDSTYIPEENKRQMKYFTDKRHWHRVFTDYARIRELKINMEKVVESNEEDTNNPTMDEYIAYGEMQQQIAQRPRATASGFNPPTGRSQQPTYTTNRGPLDRFAQQGISNVNAPKRTRDGYDLEDGFVVDEDDGVDAHAYRDAVNGVGSNRKKNKKQKLTHQMLGNDNYDYDNYEQRDDRQEDEVMETDHQQQLFQQQLQEQDAQANSTEAKYANEEWADNNAAVSGDEDDDSQKKSGDEADFNNLFNDSSSPLINTQDSSQDQDDGDWAFKPHGSSLIKQSNKSSFLNDDDSSDEES